MGNWRYEGFTRDGRKVKGTLNASNLRDLKKQLRSKGIRATKSTPPSILEFDITEWMINNGLAKPFGQTEIANFTRQMAVMVGAGVPILQSLEILYKQEKHPSFKLALKKISEEVGGGKTLNEAMLPLKGFDKLYCNLIKAGETGGILDTILLKLTQYMEKQEKIKKQIKSAMIYPAAVVVVGIGVIYGMMVFVVPKFKDMLSESGQELPAITQFVVDTSEFMSEHAMVIIIGGFILFVIISKFFQTEAGKPIFDGMMMKVPLFGDVVVKGNLAAFFRTLSTMLGAGVALIDALEICRDTVDSTVIARDISKVRKAVIGGKTLTDPIGRISYFPDMVAQMVKVGEQTGKIDSMMDKISDLFEDEVNDLISNATKLIEPVILVVLGGIVAVILIAMYLPVFMQAGGVD